MPAAGEAGSRGGSGPSRYVFVPQHASAVYIVYIGTMYIYTLLKKRL